MSVNYTNIERGFFLRRLNRFVAEAEVNGQRCLVHVRNTGRCTSVIAPGAEISLQKSPDAARKTAYTLIAVNTPEYGWVNLDSLAPNKIAGEWLRETLIKPDLTRSNEETHGSKSGTLRFNQCVPRKQGFENIQPEYRFGASRIDFYAERNGEKWLIEVKGCTLAEKGVGLFPDAPTQRGAKHLRELAGALNKGYNTMLAFVIMLNGVNSVQPNNAVDPAFAEEFARAQAAGVHIAFIPCRCTPDSVSLA